MVSRGPGSSRWRWCCQPSSHSSGVQLARARAPSPQPQKHFAPLIDECNKIPRQDSPYAYVWWPLRAPSGEHVPLFVAADSLIIESSAGSGITGMHGSGSGRCSDHHNMDSSVFPLPFSRVRRALGGRLSPPPCFRSRVNFASGMGTIARSPTLFCPILLLICRGLLPVRAFL